MVQGNSRLAGFELSAEAHPDRHIHLTAGAAYVRGENTSTDTPLPWVPPLNLSLAVRFEADSMGALWDPYVELGGETNSRQGRLDPAESTVPGYTLARLGTGFEFKAAGRTVLVDFTVRNLFDKRYADFLSRYKTFALDQGRNAILRVGFKF